MKPTNPFPCPLHYEGAGMINGKRHIRVMSPFLCVTSFGRITVPAMALSDGSSIPKIAMSIIGGHPFDECLEDAVLHDYLYSPANNILTRWEADDIFLETMWNRNIFRPKLTAMYCAVRAFGWRSYRGHLK
jgi:hypothetical protein